MMKKRILVLFTVVLFAAFGLAWTARGQSDGFVIVGADANLEYGLSQAPADLLSLIAQVADRFVMEAADSSHEYGLSPAPAGLLTLVSQVADRFILEAADANHEYDVTPVSEELFGLLAQVADRMVMEAADSNHNYLPQYPVELIGDTTAPVLSDIHVQIVSPTSAIVSWTTDEFATSEVRYGSNSGAYDQTLSKLPYVKQHKLTLMGLSEDTIYYFIVRSGDQSGNVRQSIERDFTIAPEKFVYLPTIIKK